MSWTAAQKSDKACLISFLTKHEHRCVSLTSRLLNRKTDPFFERKPCVLLNKGKNGSIEGVLYLSFLGIILPVFTEATTVSENDREAIGRVARRFLKKYHSIIGTARDVERTESILDASPVSRNSYQLMTRDTAEFSEDMLHPSPHIPRHLRIRRAGLKDIRELYPLQKNYEKEEVLVHPDRFNPNGCMANLRQSLSRQIIFCAEDDTTIMAKGGTNGIGFNYCQLGGIYTLPHYRNRGISTALVIQLVREIASQGKKTCLFVKNENIPALKVYRKLGFDTREDFTVSYFF